MERQLESISKQHGYDIVYIDGAKKHFKSFSFELPGGIPSINLPKDPSNIKKEEITWRERDLLRIWYAVPDFKDKSATAWIGVYFPNDEKNLSKDAIDFIGAIFSGYLFLLLSISAISIYITHSLTHPLDQLGKHLGNLKIDTSEKITWHKNDEVGQLVYAYNSAIDALWESTEKLRKTEREVAWREMAKQVAHEIKNPLTPMKLSLQYMQRAGKLQPDLIQTLLPNLTTTMMEQINTLDQIATAFSQFASMPSPENIPFNLVELLEQTIEMYRHQIDDGNCLSCSFEESNYPIFADKHQIQRVVNNLLNNAVQAIPLEKEGKINIRLFQSSGQKVRLEIEDNGTGVENETQQKIFSPYFTTKSSGTGLGLAMCKDIIESAGGVIGFQSTKNERTCFWIEMPLYNKNNPLKNKEPLLSFAS
jgi:nitrogen fixation/metabolism regulation signal transduction histidine kinase